MITRSDKVPNDGDSQARIHESQIRVRYEETDQMGVVYYAKYFVWFEVARTDYLRSVGLAYRDLESGGTYLMVAGASCVYKSPARYDDLVSVQCWVSSMKNSSMTFDYRVFVNKRLVASGETVIVATNKQGKPIRIPQDLRDRIASRS